MNTQSNKEMEVLIAVKLFESGALTMSQAAKSADYTMSVINHPASDLESDVSSARESLKK
jgi:hypothetical protein